MALHVSQRGAEHLAVGLERTVASSKGKLRRGGVDAHRRRDDMLGAMRVGSAAFVVVLIAGWLVATAASAQQGPVREAEHVPVAELRYELWADVSITGACIAWWIISEALKAELAPASCLWCDPPGFDSGVREALKWQDLGFPDAFSYVTALALGPIVVFGLDLLAAYQHRRVDAAWIDLLLIAEATAIAMAMNQTIKLLAARERPISRFDTHEGPPADNHLSFYSGHATFVFALAVSAGTIAGMRGYRMLPWIWVGGLTVAFATAYLRIAADRHYFSDVLIGAAAGSATGFAIPFFFHPPRAAAVPVVVPAATPEGAMLTATWRI
jgi:membrane-associated phospholipid phosphatase